MKGSNSDAKGMTVIPEETGRGRADNSDESSGAASASASSTMPLLSSSSTSGGKHLLPKHSRAASLWLTTVDLETAAKENVQSNRLKEAEQLYKRALHARKVAEGQAQAQTAAVLLSIGIMYAEQVRDSVF